MSAMTYLVSSGDRDFIGALPLEAYFRGIPAERTVARLRTERSLFDGGLLSNDPASPWMIVVVSAENAGDGALSTSLQTLALQACPHIRVVVLPDPGVDVAALRSFIDRTPSRPASTEVWADLGAECRRQLRKAHYVTFLRHGDLLHPSAAAWLATHATSAKLAGDAAADVVVWGELQPDGTGGLAWAQRNPGLQRETLLHYPYIRNAFAVSSRLLIAYPGDLQRELKQNSLHLLQIWLAHQGKPKWIAHPEYFLIRSPLRRGESPDKVSVAAYAGHEEQYRKLFREVAGSHVLSGPSENGGAPYSLRPREVPGIVSVIILFRDKPELTLRAVRSVARQAYGGFLEVILVNNQSSKESLAVLRAGLSGMVGTISSWKIIDYNKPFNHSAQCNAGIEASLGEAIVLLNNDCELLSAEALAEMSAWAMLPGVASVGVCIRDPVTGKEASGMEARLSPTNYFDSIVEERSGAAFTPFVRECFGNTFACAAIARSVLHRAGGLDELRFPNGYNDVDFVCRTRELGLRHLALGHIKATHAPGQSRERTDESVQKILIRALYPAAAGGLGGLIFDDGLVRAAQKRPSPRQVP
jgi:GT2 family glycosyltransferase